MEQEHLHIVSPEENVETIWTPILCMTTHFKPERFLIVTTSTTKALAISLKSEWFEDPSRIY
jgi:hypothetical protein